MMKQPNYNLKQNHKVIRRKNMNYFRVREFEEDYQRPINDCCIYKTNKNVKKGDIVVIENPCGQNPITAEVVSDNVSELKALTVRYEIKEVIAVVDMTEYNTKRQKKLQKAVLAEKLKEKMDEVKLVENFRKFSEKDDEMRELFKQFQDMNTSSESKSDVTYFD